jgi:hypothetical protein
MTFDVLSRRVPVSESIDRIYRVVLVHERPNVCTHSTSFLLPSIQGNISDRLGTATSANGVVEETLKALRTANKLRVDNSKPNKYELQSTEFEQINTISVSSSDCFKSHRVLGD